MSEPNSLFIKIKISQEQLEKFKQSRPVASILNNNWLNWWELREFNDKQSLTTISSYSTETNGELLEYFLEDIDMAAKEEYDAEKQLWYFYSLHFSENYLEIIPMISMIKDFAHYLDPESSGQAVLYDFLWGGDQVMFHVEIANKEASLSKFRRIKEIDRELIEESMEKLADLKQNQQRKFGN